MKRIARATAIRAEIAEHMADAVTYLMRVAGEEGFDEISHDLIPIRNKLISISEELGRVRDLELDRLVK